MKAFWVTVAVTVHGDKILLCWGCKAECLSVVTSLREAGVCPLEAHKPKDIPKRRFQLYPL